MKTNQIMIRDNDAFIQRAKDGFFNATALLSAWNNKEGGKPKQMGSYKDNKSTAEFIDQLKSEGVEKPMITSRGSGGGTWMHPKLFIDFAMWVSVEFKSIVIDYVLDGLIKSRHEAGDYYNEMCAAIVSTHIEYYGTKPNPTIYINEARKLRDMLGLKDKDRNEMSEKELSNITQMQKLNAMLLRRNMGKVARDKQLMLQAELLNV